MAENLLDRIYGCLIGGAVGDALGAPIEGWYYTEIREKYGRLREMLPGTRGNTGALYGGTTGNLSAAAYDGPVTPPGCVTDDTTLRHYICLAIVAKGGRITPADLASVLLEHMNRNRFWLNERIVLRKLEIGMNPYDTGRGQPPAGCATMAIAPIGVINAGNPAQAYQDALDIASLNQDADNRDAAATTAAGVAAAFLPGASPESVIQAMFDHSAETIRRALVLTMDMAYASADVDDFVEKYYATMLDWTWPAPPKRGGWNKERHFSGSSVEFMPVVPALLYLCKGDVNECIVEGANFGRDCDTIASVVGSVAGVLQGASAIRKDWVDTVEEANQPFFEELEGRADAGFKSMADRLLAALKQEHQSVQARAVALDELLAS